MEISFNSVKNQFNQVYDNGAALFSKCRGSVITHLNTLSSKMHRNSGVARNTIIGSSVAVFAAAHFAGALVARTPLPIVRTPYGPKVSSNRQQYAKAVCLSLVTGAAQLGGMIGVSKALKYTMSRQVLAAITVSAFACEFLIQHLYIRNSQKAPAKPPRPENKEKKLTVPELQAEITKLKAENEKQADDLNQAKLSTASARNQLAIAIDENVKIQAKFEDAEKKVKELTNLLEQLSTTKTDLEKLNKSLKEQAQEATQKLIQQKNIADSFEQAAKDAKSLSEGLHTQNQQYDLEIGKLKQLHQTAVDELEKERKIATQVAVDLQAIINTQETKIKSLEQELTNKKSLGKVVTEVLGEKDNTKTEEKTPETKSV